MMTRMSAVGPEALTRRDRISSGLSTMIREGSTKMGSANTAARRDKLLGISVSPPTTIGSSPLSTTTATTDLDGELKEEDIWGTDEFPPTGPPPLSSSSEENLQVLDDPQPPRVLRRHWLGEPSPLGLSSINNTNTGNAGARKPSSSRMIPHAVSSSASAFDSTSRHHHHQSAPVNIPDWNKILRMESRKSHNKENGGRRVGLEIELDEDEDGDGDGEAGDVKIPPHELIAREYAKSHTAFSVYEGAGRTLKGMDLSRVRNAVWKQTGFMGG